MADDDELSDLVLGHDISTQTDFHRTARNAQTVTRSTFVCATLSQLDPIHGQKLMQMLSLFQNVLDMSCSVRFHGTERTAISSESSMSQVMERSALMRLIGHL